MTAEMDARASADHTPLPEELQVHHEVGHVNQTPREGATVGVNVDVLLWLSLAARVAVPL